MDSYSLIVLLAVTPWLFMLCRSDWKNRVLPNYLTLGGAAVALVWRFGWGGVPFFLDGLFAALLCGLFLFVPFLLRGAGAGDVKMLFAAGAVVGWNGILNLLMFVSVAGLAVAVYMQLNGMVDSSRLKHCFRCVFDWRYDRVAGRAALPPKENERVRIPFGLAVAIGLWLTLLLRCAGV